ncbi:MAG: hypothetical protein ACHQYP_10840 [Nitrospiria bacterium]
MVIDFRVRLYDGQFLTDFRQRNVLEIFKCWLCIQDHVDATGGQIAGMPTVKNRVYKTLQLIDYFLLNAESIGLCQDGLEAVSEMQLKQLLADLARSSQVINTVYEWPKRLTNFLREKIKSNKKEIISPLLTKMPFLEGDVPDPADCLLNLTDSEIIQSRAWLWINGFYKRSKNETHWLLPNSRMLANQMYENTLHGRNLHSVVPLELGLRPIENFAREFPKVPVWVNLEDRLSNSQLLSYKDNLRQLGLLSEIKLPVPLSALRTLDEKSIDQALNLKSKGRYRNLPQEAVFSALCKSIEFAIEYGDDLIKSYLSLAREAHSCNLTCQTYLNKFPIAPHLTPKISRLGVRTWTIADVRIRRWKSNIRFSEGNYFKQLRANEGLRELLRVFYGAVQVCVGTLMARRQGELMDLLAGRCLDTTESHLIFFNRKSGQLGLLEKEARPIPKVAVRLIKQLEQLQEGMIELKLITKPGRLFAYPSRSGRDLVQPFQPLANASIDLFCDYVETPLNQHGQRYYIRLHQLRRFFAMLFFWGSSFGGMETLRWFLVHTDVEHLYHYITESTNGWILRSVKAHYALEQTKSNAIEAEALADLLEKHFGTRNFSVLEDQELEEYIEELLDEGQVEIEPEFIETPEGKRYRILITTTPKGRSI